jgi:hypothetical protein
LPAIQESSHLLSPSVYYRVHRILSLLSFFGLFEQSSCYMFKINANIYTKSSADFPVFNIHLFAYVFLTFHPGPCNVSDQKLCFIKLSKSKINIPKT